MILKGMKREWKFATEKGILERAFQAEAMARAKAKRCDTIVQ